MDELHELRRRGPHQKLEEWLKQLGLVQEVGGELRLLALNMRNNFKISPLAIVHGGSGFQGLWELPEKTTTVLCPQDRLIFMAPNHFEKKRFKEAINELNNKDFPEPPQPTAAAVVPHQAPAEATPQDPAEATDRKPEGGGKKKKKKIRRGKGGDKKSKKGGSAQPEQEPQTVAGGRPNAQLPVNGMQPVVQPIHLQTIHLFAVPVTVPVQLVRRVLVPAPSAPTC